MKTEAMPSSRSRAEILGSIAAIPHAVQGKICEMRKKLAGGKTATYYNLQYWSDGRNHSIHVPREKLAEFKEAVEGGRKLQDFRDHFDRMKYDHQQHLGDGRRVRQRPRERADAFTHGWIAVEAAPHADICNRDCRRN